MQSLRRVFPSHDCGRRDRDSDRIRDQEDRLDRDSRNHLGRASYLGSTTSTSIMEVQDHQKKFSWTLEFPCQCRLPVGPDGDFPTEGTAISIISHDASYFRKTYTRPCSSFHKIVTHGSMLYAGQSLAQSFKVVYQPGFPRFKPRLTSFEVTPGGQEDITLRGMRRASQGNQTWTLFCLGVLRSTWSISGMT